MPLPSAEMIERAARASFLQFMGESYVGLWESQSREERQEWTDQARAALSAVLPDVVESAVKEVLEPEVMTADGKYVRFRTHVEIVQAIRSLIPKENDNG